MRDSTVSGATRTRAGELDAFVAGRIRERRIAIGLTQKELAVRSGVTFQQIQKYERGVDRISASRLLGIAAALGVHLDFFFADAPGGGANRGPASGAGASDSYTVIPEGPDSKEMAELLYSFVHVKDTAQRQAVIRLAKSLSTFSEDDAK